MSDNELQTLLDGIWQRLAKAVNDPIDPWRMPAFGTQGLNGPSVRTMVLRSADASERVLTAQTDIRSTKIPDFRKEPRIAWLFFNPFTKEQVRATGRAVIHHDDEITGLAWSNVPEANQFNYTTDRAPGAAINDPSLGQAKEADLARAYANFAVIRSEIIAIDWLQIGEETHRRARFSWNGYEWLATWAVP